MALPDYQQRVLEEKNELQGRCDRLAGFMGGQSFMLMGPDERCRLQAQFLHMCAYLAVIKERIRHFQAE